MQKAYLDNNILVDIEYGNLKLFIYIFVSTAISLMLLHRAHSWSPTLEET